MPLHVTTYNYYQSASPADGWVVCSSEVEAGQPGLEQPPQLEEAGQARGAHMGFAPSVNQE